MPAGFKHNTDLLLDATDRDAFRTRFPQFAYAFDDPALRALFEPADLHAAKAKRRSRRAGIIAVGLVTASLMIGAFSPLLMGEPWFRIVLAIAAVAAVAGLVIGWAGILSAGARDEWLRHRYLCERIRQLHFQTLVRWAPMIIDAARRNDPENFLAARLARTEKFRNRIINPSAVKLTHLLSEQDEDEVWLVEADDTAMQEDQLSSTYFQALEELRLRHQVNFTNLQLMSFWTFPPKSTLQTAKLLTGIGAFSALLLLALGVVGLVIDAATGQLANLTHALMVCLAVILLAVRTLEEGFQVHGDVGRYRLYDAPLRRLTERFRPKAMDVLCVLAARHGEVVSREALIDAVWAVRFGGDESLTRVISLLRKSLGAGAIETVAKRGYRLAAEVRPADETPEGPEVASAPSQPPPAGSVRRRTGRAYRLSRQGLGPMTMFPVSGLDFWRLPAGAMVLAIALALGVGAADLLLMRPG